MPGGSDHHRLPWLVHKHNILMQRMTIAQHPAVPAKALGGKHSWRLELCAQWLGWPTQLQLLACCLSLATQLTEQTSPNSISCKSKNRKSGVYSESTTHLSEPSTTKVPCLARSLASKLPQLRTMWPERLEITVQRPCLHPVDPARVVNKVELFFYIAIVEDSMQRSINMNGFSLKCIYKGF